MQTETGETTRMHDTGGSDRREALGGLTVERKNEIEKCAKAVPEMRRALFVRAAEGTTSPRQAIKAKCQECVGYEDVTVRIRDCSCGRCPLWAFRPYQGQA